jgi:hypothetical protein
MKQSVRRISKKTQTVGAALLFCKAPFRKIFSAELSSILSAFIKLSRLSSR